MRVVYTTTVVATCPVDGTPDVYELTVICDDCWFPVENILAAVERVVGDNPLFQEELTDALGVALKPRGELPGSVTVETFGVHSGVQTTVTA